MPKTVADIVETLELPRAEHVCWGEKPGLRSPGIYFVSLSPDPASNAVLPEAPISLEAVERWLSRVPDLTLHGSRPEPSKLAGFLSRFWLPDENIVYIGKAARLGARIGQMFRHTLGAPSPHAGGHWLQVLCVEKYVHFSCTSVQGAEQMEREALRLFMEGVSEETRGQLYNPMPLPFANRRGPDGGRKQACIGHSVG